MNRAARKVFRVTLAVTAGIGCLLADGDVWLSKSGSLVTKAYAVVGRPLTPVSYAGVARRTTLAPVVVAPAAVGVVVVRPACVQAVDPYGRVYTRCY